MKIALTVTVDIDVDTWATEYALDRSEVRDDAKTYLEQALHEHLLAMPVAPLAVAVR